ncbi:MAG: hypothetical protein HYY06_33470, partial [Deltaproteobacteria bacterium]|nr:hypothetical protein [Deltaproteobacteria bacterium]
MRYRLGSMGAFTEELSERAISTYPTPIADAYVALAAAGSLHERRDRIVEVFRAALRTLGAAALAARLTGPRPPMPSPQADELLRTLRTRPLMDGQWVGLARELLRPFAGDPEAHPLPSLVELFHGRAKILRGLDELLDMRKSDTVAHGTTGDEAEVRAVLTERAPQLEALLRALEPLWERARLVVPLRPPEREDERQPAWLLAGMTPPRGRFRRVDLAAGVRVAPGEALFVDGAGRPVLTLQPVVIVRPPSPEAVGEVFFLDGRGKRGSALYLALPSTAEHEAKGVWPLVDAALEPGRDPEEQAPAAPDRPYRGLASFGPEHAGLFFGRDAEKEAIANLVRAHGLVTLAGASGSGKTSLLRAGVGPALQRRDRSVPEGAYRTSAREGGYALAYLRPGARPMLSLARNLHEALDGLGEPGETDAELARDDVALAERALEWASSRGRMPVIVVDQAEELLTLCADAAERGAFARVLAVLGGSDDGPSRVVLSVRGDFFTRLSELEPIARLYARQVEPVAVPMREELIAALEEPARCFGVELEGGLAKAMVDDVAGAPGALALLQFVADQLWGDGGAEPSMTLAAYAALGGAVGALSRHADAILEKMTEAQRAEARELCLRLVTAEGTRAVVLLSEAAAVASEPVRDALVAARLVTAREDEAGRPTLELAHEALIEGWGTLARWRGGDREGQARLTALQRAARSWEEARRRRELLWRGEVLAEDRAWRRRARPRLTALEEAFVEASEAAERRDRRLVAGTVAAVVAVVGAFALLAGVQWQAAERSERAARAREAEAQRERARAMVQALVAEARRRRMEHQPAEALALLRAAAKRAARPNEVAAVESAGLFDLAASALPIVLEGHTDVFGSVAFSPDGTRVATASEDRTARLWDAGTGALLHVFQGHTDVVESVAFSPDATRVATASEDRTARLWDAGTGALLHVLQGHTDVVHSIDFSPDGTRVATASGDRTVRLWDAGTGALLHTLEGHTDVVESVAFSPDGTRVATASADRTARLWDVGTGALLRALEGHTEVVYSIDFSPDGTCVATASGDRTVRLWDVGTGVLVRALEGHTRDVLSIAFSPDGRSVATASWDGTARLWDVGTGMLLDTLEGHTDAVESVAFSPDGSRVATGSLDRTARLWDVGTGALLHTLEGHTAAVEVAFSPDGTHVATVSEDGTPRLWDTGAVMLLHTVVGYSLGVSSIAFSPDGRRVATASGDVRLWDVGTGVLLRALEGHTRDVLSIAFSPDGRSVATASRDRTARLWDAGTGTLLHPLEGHTDAVESVAFSSDGTRVATASRDRTARVWDAGTGMLLCTVEG